MPATRLRPTTLRFAEATPRLAFQKQRCRSVSGAFFRKLNIKIRIMKNVLIDTNSSILFVCDTFAINVARASRSPRETWSTTTASRRSLLGKKSRSRHYPHVRPAERGNACHSAMSGASTADHAISRGSKCLLSTPPISPTQSTSRACGGVTNLILLRTDGILTSVDRSLSSGKS